MKPSAFSVLAGSLGLLIVALFPVPALGETPVEETRYLLPVPTRAEKPIKVKRARAEFRESEQFFRITEFFTERESTGGDVIVRSDPSERAGFYWTIKLSKYPYRHDAVDEAIQLEVILPGDVEASLFTFPLGPAKKRNPLILAGLTGENWPDPDALPLAWRISFVDAEGNLLAREQSFLWSIEE